MKTARRLLSVLLALVMVLALVACAGGGDVTTNSGSNNPSSNVPGDTNDTPGGSAAEDFVQPEAPYDEMEGKNYIIIQHDAIDRPFRYSQDSRMGELVAERIAEVEEKYGCTITFEQVAYEPAADFVTQIRSRVYMDNGGDMVWAYNNATLRRTLGTGGDESLMVDLLAVDHIINFWDFEKWGNIYARETMMAGGKFYGVTPALWTDCTPLPYYTVVYNKELLEQFGQVDLQEYWENEEWDRDTMMDVITSCYDDTGADNIWGMTAGVSNMIKSSIFAAGGSYVDIEKINADGTVDWTAGILSADSVEALTWLKAELNTNAKYFNDNGKANAGWDDGPTYFINGQSALLMTRPLTLFGTIVTDAKFDFGLITWAGAEANVLAGYYENTYSVAIPVFAQNAEHTAYLMYDLFEGMDGIETYEDVLNFYREEYFDSDLDVTLLVRDGAKLEYSYWPNGVEDMFYEIANGFKSVSNMKTLLENASKVVTTEINDYIVPNKVQLEKYRQAGYFN